MANNAPLSFTNSNFVIFFRHIKIYDVSSYQVVHTLDVPGSVLSIGVPVSICFVKDKWTKFMFELP